MINRQKAMERVKILLEEINSLSSWQCTGCGNTDLFRSIHPAGIVVCEKCASKNVAASPQECWNRMNAALAKCQQDAAADALRLSDEVQRLRLEREQQHFYWRGLAATHRCKICGAKWIDCEFVFGAGHGGWSLASKTCGRCCDNAPMGEQIEPIGVYAEITNLRAEIAEAKADVRLKEALSAYAEEHVAWVEARSRLTQERDDLEAAALSDVKTIIDMQARGAELEAALDRDKTGLASALARCRDEIEARAWVLEGRGPYEWDDDRYREESGLAFRAVVGIIDEALKASGQIAHAALAPKGDARQETSTMPQASFYGLCPRCRAPGKTRERRPGGNDWCVNGHTYPSASAIKVPFAPPKKCETCGGSGKVPATEDVIRAINKEGDGLVAGAGAVILAAMTSKPCTDCGKGDDRG